MTTLTSDTAITYLHLSEPEMIAAGVTGHKRDGIRVLAKGEISVALTLTVSGASRPAVEAVEKAGTTDIMPVVEALESGMTFVGPAGPVVVDGPSHRNIQDVHLARVDENQKFEIIDKFEQVNPTREVIGAGSCDLTGADQDSHRMIEPKF